MTTCKFCDAMRVNHQVEEISRSWSTDAELKQYGRYMIEYSVAIVKRSWYQKIGKRKAGRTVEFRYRGLGFELNYCPECGKKVRSDGSDIG